MKYNLIWSSQKMNLPYPIYFIINIFKVESILKIVKVFFIYIQKILSGLGGAQGLDQTAPIIKKLLTLNLVITLELLV